MPIKVVCAWCGGFIGVKEGEGPEGLDTTHSICADCAGTVGAGLQAAIDAWPMIERRKPGDRRKKKCERVSLNNPDLLLIVDGIIWLDNRGAQKRRSIRRKKDRELLAKLIGEALIK